jgi:DNA-directed RNA polymerase subunit K
MHIIKFKSIMLLNYRNSSSVFEFQGDQLVKEKYTRFERARIVGARSLQIAMGAPVLVEDDGRLDPLSVAIEELKAGVIPITVKRKTN